MYYDIYVNLYSTSYSSPSWPKLFLKLTVFKICDCLFECHTILMNASLILVSTCALGEFCACIFSNFHKSVNNNIYGDILDVILRDFLYGA
jgi:hypothetical protein